MLIGILVVLALAVLASTHQTGVEAAVSAPATPENPYRPNSWCWLVWEACRQAGFTAEQAKTMTAIARAESGCNPQATNNNPPVEYSIGVFQLNLLAHPEISETDARDVYRAAQWAYALSGGGTNYRPWSAYTNGKYRSYVL